MTYQDCESIPDPTRKANQGSKETSVTDMAKLAARAKKNAATHTFWDISSTIKMMRLRLFTAGPNEPLGEAT